VSGFTATLIVLAGWLAMAAVTFVMVRKALVTGIAPWQFFIRLLGRPQITRDTNKIAFWWATAPTILLFAWAALGSVALILALAGVFGPLQ